MSYTYYQAKNPATINDEVVTESELSERLSDINYSLSVLVLKTDNISRDRDKTIIPDIILSDIINRDNGPDSNMSISSYDGNNVLNIWSNKLVECYGALTATNISSTNKADIESLQTKTQNLTGIIGNVTGFNGELYADNIVSSNGTLNDVLNNTQNIVRIPGTEEDPISYTEIDGVSFQSTLERISNTEGTLTNVSYDPVELKTVVTGVLTVNGNITASNLTGIGYNNNFNLQTSDYTTATVISNHLHVNLNGVSYKPYLGIRAYKDNLVNEQEMMISIGKSHTRAISFVYKHNDTQANCEYRIDHPGRVAYRCYYGSTKTEHEIRGNLKVYGTITENASRTITHYTMYEGDLQPGFFVESTGQIFHNGETSYENCMVTVRQATTFSNNIIGVCTEIMNDEVRDCYGNVNQPAGKYCRIATHGDCLIKCESATYTCGDIIVPSTNGYGKKGSSTDVLNCMLSMTPRLKVTSVDTDEIDPQCVVGFITV